MQASSVLSRAIATGLATSQLPPLQITPPITTTDLLQAINFLKLKNTANLLHAVSF
jgi:hypothetical protein